MSDLLNWKFTMLRFAQAAAAMARTAERRCGELQFNLWGKLTMNVQGSGSGIPIHHNKQPFICHPGILEKRR